MEFRTLAQDKVSSVALGTWVFAADCWGGADRRHCISAVCTALKNDINLIDTAPVYGHGRAEEIIGEALKDRRENVFIATKCGLPVRHGKIIHDLSPQSVVQEVDASLKRLQRDVIDLMQCHWPDPNTSIEETMNALRRLQEDQKIRYIGVSNFDVDLIKRAQKEASIVSYQGQYSLLHREMERDILPYCRENSIAVLAYGALGGGILTGKYHEPPVLPKSDVRQFFYTHYQGKRFSEIKQALDELRSWGKPLPQVAINWVRQQPGVTSVLVGARNREQVETNAAAGSWILDQHQLAELDNMI